MNSCAPALLWFADRPDNKDGTSSTSHVTLARGTSNVARGRLRPGFALPRHFALRLIRQIRPQRVVRDPQLAAGLALVVAAAFVHEARVAAAPRAHRFARAHGGQQQDRKSV